MRAPRRTLRTEGLSVLRLLAGLLLAAICFQWSSDRDLQQWLFPLVFATGMITTLATGPRWSWLVTTGYLVVQGGTHVANAVRGPLDWFYHGNLLAAVLAQSETIVITAAFVLIADLGGLCGWVITSLITHFVPTENGRSVPRD